MSWKYNASTGAMVALLTWTFFVLCTPVADGGFMLAFPIRLLFGLRMLVTQIVIWFVAIGINLAAMSYSPNVYDLTLLTGLLKQILIHPYPYWSILIISALGTLLSIFFGDEMIDVTSHKDRTKQHAHGFKHRTLVVLGFSILAVIFYYYLLETLNVSVPTPA